MPKPAAVATIQRGEAPRPRSSAHCADPTSAPVITPLRSAATTPSTPPATSWAMKPAGGKARAVTIHSHQGRIRSETEGRTVGRVVAVMRTPPPLRELYLYHQDS